MVVDDSAAVQDIITRILEGQGYRTVPASNGVAALAYPEIADVAVVIVDSDMDGFDGEETVKSLRAIEETHNTPILVLIPENQEEQRASQSLFSANGYLLKPFEAPHLLRKIRGLIQEINIVREVHKRLQEAADRYMSELAGQHIDKAIDKRTQIIAERAIQNIVNTVDQQARREVDAKVTALSAEKEQDLVRSTVHEVAQSMVDKLAEKKVTEAMEKILAEETARTVKRIADTTLPNLIRERLRDSIENTLPREINTRVQRAAEELVPEISSSIVKMIEGVAQQSVPKVARDRVPEIAERQLRSATGETIPNLVRELVEQNVGDQIRLKLNPQLENARYRIQSRVRVYSIVMTVLFGIFLALAGYFAWKIQSGT